MAADLHIHVLKDCDENDLSNFFAHFMGSKWFNPSIPYKNTKESRDRVMDTPSVWIGEVSWLKAALFNDSETFIPDIVSSIYEIIGEDLPLITDDLIKEILEAFNSAKDHPNYDVASKEKVISFLESHKGYKVFTVSW